jgi:hypothetical protein
VTKVLTAIIIQQLRDIAIVTTARLAFTAISLAGVNSVQSKQNLQAPFKQPNGIIVRQLRDIAIVTTVHLAIAAISLAAVNSV